MPFRLVTPAARSSLTTGARSAALATARAVRALSALRLAHMATGLHDSSMPRPR